MHLQTLHICTDRAYAGLDLVDQLARGDEDERLADTALEIDLLQQAGGVAASLA